MTLLIVVAYMHVNHLQFGYQVQAYESERSVNQSPDVPDVLLHAMSFLFSLLPSFLWILILGPWLLSSPKYNRGCFHCWQDCILQRLDKRFQCLSILFFSYLRFFFYAKMAWWLLKLGLIAMVLPVATNLLFISKSLMTSLPRSYCSPVNRVT